MELLYVEQVGLVVRRGPPSAVDQDHLEARLLALGPVRGRRLLGAFAGRQRKRERAQRDEQRAAGAAVTTRAGKHFCSQLTSSRRRDGILSIAAAWTLTGGPPLA